MQRTLDSLLMQFKNALSAKTKNIEIAKGGEWYGLGTGIIWKLLQRLETIFIVVCFYDIKWNRTQSALSFEHTKLPFVTIDFFSSMHIMFE